MRTERSLRPTAFGAPKASWAGDTWEPIGLPFSSGPTGRSRRSGPRCAPSSTPRKCWRRCDLGYPIFEEGTQELRKRKSTHLLSSFPEFLSSFFGLAARGRRGRVSRGGAPTVGQEVSPAPPALP